MRRSATYMVSLLFAAGTASHCVKTACDDADPTCNPALFGLRRSVLLTNPFFTRFVFTVTSGDNLIRAFSLDESTGALTQVASIATTANSTISMNRHPTLPILVIPENAPSDGIRSFTYNATTGALAAVNNQVTGNSNSHRAFVMPSGGNYLFNSVQSGTTKYFYGTIDSAGTLGAPSLKDQSLIANCQAMSLHPSGKVFYTDGCPSGGIQRFTIDGAGNVANVGNTVYNGTDSLGRAGVFDPAGHMFVVSTTGFVASFNVDTTTGALSQISGIATGNNGSNHAVVSPWTGDRLYVVFPAQGEIREYAIAFDGSLSQTQVANVVPAGLQYERSCIDASGKFIFLGRFNGAGAVQTILINSDHTLSAGPNLASGNTITDCVTTSELR